MSIKAKLQSTQLQTMNIGHLHLEQSKENYVYMYI